MRITEQVQNSLIKILSEYVKTPAELRLFGSRTDTTAKGGDIDLLLIVHQEAIRKKLQFDKAEILGKIKGLIGEQKIDLIIATRNSLQESAFYKSILPTSICLKVWN